MALRTEAPQGRHLSIRVCEGTGSQGAGSWQERARDRLHLERKGGGMEANKESQQDGR